MGVGWEWGEVVRSLGCPQLWVCLFQAASENWMLSAKLSSRPLNAKADGTDGGRGPRPLVFQAASQVALPGTSSPDVAAEIGSQLCASAA